MPIWELEMENDIEATVLAFEGVPISTMITRRIARPLSGFASSSNWVCPSCRTSQPSLLRRQNAPQRRTLLTAPTLSFHDTFAERGIPGLVTATGYRIGWTEYQALLVQKLNDLLAGEPFENQTPKNLALQFARDPMSAAIFNHASMAHNNHFFYSGLSTVPQKLDDCPSLKENLEQAFGSIDTLRTTMLDTATSMFGPGFVWLVWARNPSGSAANTFGPGGKGSFKILSTYIAGTPYPEAGYRQQGLDMATNNADSYRAYQAQQPTNTAGSFGRHSAPGKQAAKMPPGGTQVVPLLCVNTWEHVYIYDYGLSGKRKYLADWWDCINWHQVETNLPRDAETLRFSRGEAQSGRAYGSAG